MKIFDFRPTGLLSPASLVTIGDKFMKIIFFFTQGNDVIFRIFEKFLIFQKTNTSLKFHSEISNVIFL